MNDGPLSQTETRELLARLAHMPKKWLGQNFLIDGNIVRKSLELAEIKPGDRVLEVGPGLGTLTRTLLGAGVELHAVEADPTMVYHLKQSLLPRWPQAFHLTEGDAVEKPLADLVAPADGSFKVVANLPYAISTPWMDAICAGPHPEIMVLMLQREAADRLTAEVGTKHWSAVTAQVSLAFENRTPNASVPGLAKYPGPCSPSAANKSGRPPRTSFPKQRTCVRGWRPCPAMD
ncbi:MAG: ribosomal RNA small subunit methyltransferase A [Verrucomicrobiae bacterium]|nr:ribosomal RNA small subunit methyltransferase A [Verrucomicrobiae bacterium]